MPTKEKATKAAIKAPVKKAKTNKAKKTNETLEQTLFKAADKLRKNIDAAEYKHIVLGLIFLKYISDSFEEMHQKLLAGEGEYEGPDPEDKDEYKAENVFFVPKTARWQQILDAAKTPKIGSVVDSAMDATESENPQLKGILPKVYVRQNLDKSALGQLIDLIGNIALGDEAARSKDILGGSMNICLGSLRHSKATTVRSRSLGDMQLREIARAVTSRQKTYP